MPTKIEGKKFYTVLEAAGIVDVVPETIRNYIKAGKVKTAFAGKPVLIREDALLHLVVTATGKQKGAKTTKK